MAPIKPGLSTPSLLRKDYRKVFTALVLVKSKPPDLSLKEYLHQIRSHISTTPPPKQDGSRNYADALSFWKDIHKKSQSKIATMEQKINRLENENRALREGTEVSPRERHTANSRRKRKRDDSQTQAQECYPNKWRLSDNSSPAREEIFDEIKTIGDDLELSPPNAEVTAYFGHLFSLRQMLLLSSPTPQNLAACVTALCSDATVLVFSINQTEQIVNPTPAQRTSTRNNVVMRKTQTSPNDNNNNNNNNNNRATIEFVGRTFKHLIEGLGFLNTAEGFEQKHKILYTFVKVFAAILTQIGKLSVNIPGWQKDTLEKPNKGRGRRRKPIPDHQSSPRLGDIRLDLCKLFVRMLSTLDLKEEWSREVVDGAMYHLLARAGTTLKAVVFRDEYSEQVSSGKGVMPNCDQNILLAEAPFLVWILERAMAVLQHSTIRTTTKPAPKPPPAAHRDLLPARPELSDIARTRLQNTLLKAIFPGDVTSFEERLFEPSDPGLDFENTLPIIERGDVATWFKSEIWRLIGWDTLLKHIDIEQGEDHT